MEIELTADQKAFAREAIQTGRVRREEEVVKEALALWEDRERVRAEILAAVDTAEASLAGGQGRVITQQSMRELAGEIKKRDARGWPSNSQPASNGTSPFAGSGS